MIDSIKITSLTNIGANLSYTSIFPVVNVTGTPITNKANLQIIGNYILSQAGGANMVQAAQATLAQSVVNAAQPNITSVGTLSASTLKISGGTSGYILRTDGLGNLTWIAPTSTVSGSNAQVQFNNAGSFGSSANFTYDNGNNILNVIRANASYLTAYESVSTANLSANGLATITRINVTNTANLGSVSNITITGGSNGQVLTTNGNGVLSWKNDANSSYGNSNVVTLLSAFGSNTISTTGNVSVGNIIANNLGNIATVSLTGSNTNVLYGNGVFAAASGGNANTGNVTFNDINVIGTGNLNLQPDPADAAAYVNIYLTGAADIHMAAGAAGANLILGTDEEANVAVLQGGNVAIQAGNVSGTKTWNFDTAGNLTLPLNSVVYETNIPDQGLSGSAIALKPAGGTTTNQQLLIYPTANDGDHIHLTSGNLYATELFLGSDNFYVKLANTGNVIINSNDGNSNSAMWTFDPVGNLTVPGDIIGPANANLVVYANAGVHSFTFADDGTFYAPDNVVLGGTTIDIGPGANALNLANSTLVISSTSNAYIQAVINNVSDNGSADWVAQGHLGNDDGGWVDMGFTSSFYSDPDYTITGPGDGYIITQAYLPGQAPAVGNGSLVFATGENGTQKDIIFGTGGFLTANIFGRISDANNALELSRAGSSIDLIGGGNISNANVISATSFSGNGSGLTNLPVPTVTQDITSNGAMSIMLYDGNIKYNNYATVEPSTGNIAGNNISASGNISANNFTGNGGGLSNVATKVAGSWTLVSGTNTVSLSVPGSGTYTIWVNGNIPNGIITYTATAVVTNTNVPVLGDQYGWYYAIGNALVLTSMPNQFVGTAGNISNVNTYLGNTANVFTFGITNNSGANAVVNYGYTKL